LPDETSVMAAPEAGSSVSKVSARFGVEGDGLMKICVVFAPFVTIS
jgi:hypothetical protein